MSEDRLRRLKNLFIGQYGSGAPNVTIHIEDALWLADRVETERAAKKASIIASIKRRADFSANMPFSGNAFKILMDLAESLERDEDEKAKGAG